MTGFNHMLTGTAIALSVQSPWLAPVLSFASHFILDALPHYDPGYRGPHQQPEKHFKYYIALEIIAIPAVMATSILLFHQHWLLVLGCMLTAYLPDVLWALERRHGHRTFLNKFYAFHNKIQWGERPWGWTIEAVYFFAVGYVLVSNYYI